MDSRLKKYVDGVYRYNTMVSAWLETIALGALLLIMLLTVVDVIGAKAFRHPVFGSLDIVMMAQVVAVSFGAASTLIYGGHVAVDLFVPLLPQTLRKLVTVSMELLSLLLFVIIAWRLFVYGHQLQVDGEVSPTARIPLYPFAYGIAMASIPVCIQLCINVVRAVLPSSSPGGPIDA